MPFNQILPSLILIGENGDIFQWRKYAIQKCQEAGIPYFDVMNPDDSSNADSSAREAIADDGSAALCVLTADKAGIIPALQIVELIVRNHNIFLWIETLSPERSGLSQDVCNAINASRAHVLRLAEQSGVMIYTDLSRCTLDALHAAEMLNKINY